MNFSMRFELIAVGFERSVSSLSGHSSVWAECDAHEKGGG